MRLLRVIIRLSAEDIHRFRVNHRQSLSMAPWSRQIYVDLDDALDQLP